MQLGKILEDCWEQWVERIARLSKLYRVSQLTPKWVYGRLTICSTVIEIRGEVIILTPVAMF
ncbi:hypothetical protein SAMN05660282_02137 [Corynebacterium spheniscorum]|uniref:Uncharacterized protein n=1 Tax=Corynebacterium spheniscorum TaxID=185761 RepID=A0A1I2V606_9CORY|nr:hypothetical protein SAMN05660282_02137 [Corynebacterium spheniscorum]